MSTELDIDAQLELAEEDVQTLASGNRANNLKVHVLSEDSEES